MPFLIWLAETIGWAWLKEKLQPKSAMEEVKDAHDIEDKNRATLNDGDAAKLLRDEFSK